MVDRATLERRWIHSHEEDRAGEMVFRPAGHPFPPSRGRLAFELRADGTFAETRSGPTDRPEDAAGTWLLKDGELVLVGGPEGRRVLRIASVDGERLVVRVTSADPK